MTSASLSISLVTYNPNQALLTSTLLAMSEAVAKADVDVQLILIDNTPLARLNIDQRWLSLIWCHPFVLIQHGENLGFGGGHNVALYGLKTDYHLILNPDLVIAPEALRYGLEFMAQHPQCALLTPYATWENGVVQRLCKRYPTVSDLLLRGFAPTSVKRMFQNRLDRYEVADKLNDHDVLWDPPIVSGCFMLFRTEMLKQLGGFNSRFFLYFEDFDLSLRVGQTGRIAYVPQVKVVHHGGKASSKGWRHIWMFGRSMVIFFNIHGWCWW